MAYQSLEDKYTHQAILMKEASEALKASESHVSAMQEELMTLKHGIVKLISKGLLATQFCNMSISFLQCSLALATTNQLSHSCKSRSRCSKSCWLVRGICLLWVHPKGRWISGKRCLTSSQGQSTPTGVLLSIIHPNQPFQFQKQVRFGDRPHQPDLESDTVAGSGPQSSHIPPYASMPFCGSSQVPLNCTFDVSRIPVSNTGNAQDAATIVAEVLAAAAAQASKEFWHMREPKITKLWGGYLADAELSFLVLVSRCIGKYTRL